jgi:hypothetical protein
MKNLIDAQEFTKALIDGFGKQKRLIRLPKKVDISTGRMEESAVLMLSDMHIGKVNYYAELETGKGYQTYNTQIAIKEANRLVDGVFTINQLLSHSYAIRKLYIFGLGDLVDNDIIVKGQRFYVDVGVGAQIMLATKILEDMLVAFLNTFEEIEFILIGGNHGRLTEHREMAPFYNNFDWLLGQMLSKSFKDEPRVKIVTPESWFHLHKIYDWKFLLHHGNTVYSWMGLPYYGIVRSGKSRRTEMDVDIECIGHFHTTMEIPISSHSKTLVNGSWIEKDDFGWRQYGNLSKAEQYYFGVSPKRARSWSFVLDLKKEDK